MTKPNGVFAMAETDQGGFADFMGQTEDLQPLIGVADETSTTFLTLWTTVLAGTTAGAVIGGAIGAIIGAAVGMLVGLVILTIAELIGTNEDEIFDLNFEPLLVLTGPGLEDSPFYGGSTSVPLTFQMEGHGGQYLVTYFWQFS